MKLFKTNEIVPKQVKPFKSYRRYRKLATEKVKKIRPGRNGLRLFTIRGKLNICVAKAISNSLILIGSRRIQRQALLPKGVGILFRLIDANEVWELLLTMSEQMGKVGSTLTPHLLRVVGAAKEVMNRLPGILCASNFSFGHRRSQGHLLFLLECFSHPL
ncbi:hypothetical protein LIER_39965 [Lithospermum erythrorhizon]|uniref:Uncharacterized protein n=1 Tax=Lithospermum erythrorhizon TaxID=34254 RepID=A0AAV3QQ82_LITER